MAGCILQTNTALVIEIVSSVGSAMISECLAWSIIVDLDVSHTVNKRNGFNKMNLRHKNCDWMRTLSGNHLSILRDTRQVN